MSERGYIYFIAPATRDPIVPHVKIGHTTGDPTVRLRALQTGSPLELMIYCAFTGDKKTERLFHETFAPLRIHGEWFEVKGKLRDFMYHVLDDAKARRPTHWNDVFTAIYDVVLALEPFNPKDDPAEYMASADMRPWEWMRAEIEAIDAEAEAEEATLQ